MSRSVAFTVTTRDGLESPLDPRFGRAAGFVVVDFATREVVAELSNRHREQAHGAGTGAAALIGELGVDAIVSGNFGPKAFRALEALNVEMWSTSDRTTVGEALARLHAGELGRVTAAGAPLGRPGAGGQGRGGGGGGGGGRGGGGRGGGGRGGGQGRGRSRS